MRNLPKLYVEGKNDVSVVNGLLLRHGLDTRSGAEHLFIKDLENVKAVLDIIPDAIKANTEHPVGFIIDIDVAITNRWSAVCRKLQDAGIAAPGVCPTSGFLHTLPGYQHPFGVWLMPDCETDDSKLEHLIESLIPGSDPLWAHAQKCANEAAKIVDEANARGDGPCKRFREVDRIKAELHTWLAWQVHPGATFGAAINCGILGCDSSQAIALLRWMKSLYGFEQLGV